MVRPTVDEIRECLLAIMRDTPDHAWATPSILEAFGWREQARVRLQLRNLAEVGARHRQLGTSDHGISPAWWWPLDVVAAATCAACGRPAETWVHGAIEYAWSATGDDLRAYIPGTGGWACGARACSAVILTRQWRTIAQRTAGGVRPRL